VMGAKNSASLRADQCPVFFVFAAAGSWLLAPGSWLLAPGSWLLAPGSWLLAPGSWLLTPDFSETWSWRWLSGRLRKFNKIEAKSIGAFA
jgi:hypothetical protein